MILHAAFEWPKQIIVRCLTHWGRVTCNCVSKRIMIGSDIGLVPTRRQAIICYNIINWTRRKIILWTSNRNSYIFIHENAFERFVSEMEAILSLPQCVKSTSDIPYPTLMGVLRSVYCEYFEPIWQCKLYLYASSKQRLLLMVTVCAKTTGKGTERTWKQKQAIMNIIIFPWLRKLCTFNSRLTFFKFHISAFIAFSDARYYTYPCDPVSTILLTLGILCHEDWWHVTGNQTTRNCTCCGHN